MSNTNKKRKRRSFWEPESETLIKWLDQQSDLGTSLQLIIVDAIRKYGDGDAVKSYLRQRESDFKPEEHETVRQVEQPIQEAKPEPTEPEVQQKPKQEDVTPKPKDVEPKIKSEPERKSVRVIPSEKTEGKWVTNEKIEPKQEPKQKEQELFDPTAALAKAEQEVKEKPKEVEPKTEKPEQNEPDESEYDPIEVMMGDIGSRFEK